MLRRRITFALMLIALMLPVLPQQSAATAQTPPASEAIDELNDLWNSGEKERAKELYNSLPSGIQTELDAYAVPKYSVESAGPQQLVSQNATSSC